MRITQESNRLQETFERVSSKKVTKKFNNKIIDQKVNETTILIMTAEQFFKFQRVEFFYFFIETSRFLYDTLINIFQYLLILKQTIN